MMFTKTLAIIAATALVATSAAALDATTPTCSCTPLAATTSITSSVAANKFTPTACTFKGDEGVSYMCKFGAEDGAKEVGLLWANCKGDLSGNWGCIWT